MAKRKKTAKKDVDIDKILKKRGYSGSKWYQSNTIIGLGIAVVIVLAAVLVYNYMGGDYAGKAISMGMTENEFIRSANNCEPAIMEKKIGTATMLFEIKEECIINKKVIDMDQTEPTEIRDLFIGREMDCVYDRGDFDTDYINQISGDLGYCSGSLVDAILAVI